MDQAAEVLRSGDVPLLSQIGTLVALTKLSKEYQRAKETAECRLEIETACPAPRTPEECPWATTKFCAARLRDEAAIGKKMDEETGARLRIERAVEQSIPRPTWRMLGIATGSSIGLEETEAVRFVRHAVATSRRLVVLHGDDETGKSTAAAVWAWATKAWYFRATGLRWFTRPGGYGRDASDARLTQVNHLAIVHLDRPWAAKDGAHKHGVIHILHERIDAGRSTLLTSNLGAGDLESVFGSSLWRYAMRGGGVAKITKGIEQGQQQKGDF